MDPLVHFYGDTSYVQSMLEILLLFLHAACQIQSLVPGALQAGEFALALPPTFLHTDSMISPPLFSIPYLTSPPGDFLKQSERD